LAGGIGRTLALARGANPQTTFDRGSFQSHLDRAGDARPDHRASAIGPNAAPLQQFAAHPTGLAPIDARSIDGVRAEYQTATAVFEERLRRLLSERGIELGAGVILARNQQGDVQVTGEHPQKGAIEELFREDRELKALFSQLDAQASFLRAAELNAELQRLSDDSPPEAAAQMPHILSGGSARGFSMAVLPREIVVRFADDFPV
jgi:hypothetical protein